VLPLPDGLAAATPARPGVAAAPRACHDQSSWSLSATIPPADVAIGQSRRLPAGIRRNPQPAAQRMIPKKCARFSDNVMRQVKA
jgi:hypothetical protein